MLNFKLGIVFALISLTLTQRKPEKVEYQWKYVNYTWPSVDHYENALKNHRYIVKNNIVIGIKVWKENLYIAMPRARDGIPATLVVIDQNQGKKSPLLKPYPSWEMQQLGNCSALQFVQSMEIDPLGRMWVIDNGRVDISTKHPNNHCPPRLIVFDLENENKILLDYVFPANVAMRDTVFLNDIVLDHEDGGYAYITDTDDKYPGIIVFSLEDRNSWKVSHRSMWADPSAINFTIRHDGTRVTTAMNVNGIALSPASSFDQRLIYYCPLSSYDMYTVPTNILKQRPSSIEGNVCLLGKKPSQTGGMVMSSDGKLYFTQLAINAVAVWDTNDPPFQNNQRIVFRDDIRMQWPDTFAIDQNGRLWLTSNRQQRMLDNTVDLQVTNYRVMVLENLGVKNYQYYENGEAPELPEIQ